MEMSLMGLDVMNCIWFQMFRSQHVQESILLLLLFVKSVPITVGSTEGDFQFWSEQALTWLLLFVLAMYDTFSPLAAVKAVVIIIKSAGPQSFSSTTSVRQLAVGNQNLNMFSGCALGVSTWCCSLKRMTCSLPSKLP